MSSKGSSDIWFLPGQQQLDSLLQREGLERLVTSMSWLKDWVPS